ncbi:hypothetical protein [Paeniglutamicibacter sulfureus]|uniref:MFS family permease n=1 Tax=Paeniglutamicibacter sulfureus TaxID=43666 RepID=A0ABU2BDW6_9MICC|nr:hypothetical protein [Paeniglutamicibacter sulfureus]MDR7356541.1 MFS family permease [Paeniglutamicibacter sulfureus]
MATLPAQKIGTLIFPLLGLAVLSGAVLGSLALLPLLPSGELMERQDWHWTNVPLMLFWAAVCGAVISIPPAIGAAVAVAIQGKKHFPTSGNRQALVAALGAAAGAMVPILAYLFLFERTAIEVEGPLNVPIIAPIFILVCSCLAWAAFRGVLSILNKRNKQSAGS